MEADRQVVLDALYHREARDDRSCFAFNEASNTLMNMPPQRILPVIEDVLREIDSTTSWYSRPVKVLDMELSQAKFPALDDVLGAFLVLGAKSQSDRYVEILGSFSENLVVEVVKAIPVYFQRINDHYPFGVPPGEWLKNLLVELMQWPSDKVRGVASNVWEGMKDEWVP